MVHTTTPQLLQSGQLIKNEAANQMKNANEETLHAFLASTCGFRLFSGLKLHAAAAAAMYFTHLLLIITCFGPVLTSSTCQEARCVRFSLGRERVFLTHACFDRFRVCPLVRRQASRTDEFVLHSKAS
jgi:hypothetical protein